MSLRYKILLAIIGIMVLILGFLTINLWINAARRVKAEQHKMAELTRRLLQDWLADVEDHEDWLALKEKLNASALFRTWLVVEDELVLKASSSPIGNPETYQQDKNLRDAIQTRNIVIKGHEVWAPIDLPDGKTLGLKMDIQHLSWLEFNPIESVKLILLIMPLGTILLILSIYILLTKLVLKPVESLAGAASRIAQGDYEMSLPTSEGKDEIARLINTFSSMVTELRGYQTNLETKIEESRRKIKTTEEQLMIAQRLSATGTLAAGIAHEINNPLGGILNAVRALKRGDLDRKKSKEYLDLIIDGLNRMEETLKKILQFFPRRLAPQSTDLKPVIERALLLVQHRIEANQINVLNKLPTDLPAVFGEATELQQCFLNILINALDAVAAIRSKSDNDQDKGQIEISAETDNKNIIVILKDNGIGVTKEELSHIFDIFYTTKEPGKGTGLGLSVVHNIIQNHGGHISIESQKDLGTTVKITLPILKERMEKMIGKK